MAGVELCQPLSIEDMDDLESYERYVSDIEDGDDVSDTAEEPEPVQETPSRATVGPMPVLSLYRRLLVSTETPAWASYLPCELRAAVEKGEYSQNAMTHMSSGSTTASLPQSSKISASLQRPGSAALATALQKLSGLEDGDLPSAGMVWSLSRNPKGCRDVQRCLETAATEKERVAIARELQGHVWDALRCPHANYVLQKVSCLLKPSDIQFVVDEVVGKGVRAVCHAARHKYGCRIIQRLLEHCTVCQVRSLVNSLLNDAVVTAMHPYGNYVMQHLIEYGTAEQRGALTRALVEHVGEAGRDEYACAVLSKAMVHGELQDQADLAIAIESVPGLFPSMACSRHGHVAARAVLATLRGSQLQSAKMQIRANLPNLRSSRYGRVVLNAMPEPIC
eukprot:TRINITY_DN10426_c0_g1_i2.p1 TRINITY_DN10426_c0_g1~~TRINITY_DN10426_c0_g1_i2.p1  ORF type:complete len:436 (+),score=59.19 TRINITY_DN10426_c0_g1_i2:131-1309(+)